MVCGCMFHQFVGVECIVTVLLDQFNILRCRKSTVTLAISVILCLLGLPLCTQVTADLTALDTYDHP